jgi:hypothetical protein
MRMVGGEIKFTSGNTGICHENYATRVLDKGLTVEEICPDYGAVGETPVVDWLALPNDAISKGCQIANGRARADILQVLPNGPALALCPELEEQLRIFVRAGEEFVLVLLVELPCNGIVDRLDNGILEERLLIGRRVETCDRTGAKLNCEDRLSGNWGIHTM